VREWLRRWWWLLLVVLAVIGLCRLRLDVDVLNLLPPDVASVRGLKLYQERFANARELILTVRAPTGELGERFAAELGMRLRGETNLVAEVSWQPPWMEEPAQAGEIIASLWYNQPPEVFAALTNRLSPEGRAEVLREGREALATSLSPLDIARRAVDPYDLLNLPTLTNFSGLSLDQAQQMFGSADGTFRMVFAQAREDLSGYQSCVDWVGAIRRIVEETRARQPEWREVTVHLTGRPAFVAEIGSCMQRDLSGSITGTAVIIAALFWLTHRRWLPMFWLLFLLGMILVGAIGLGSLILGPIHVVSLGFAAVLLGLAVDYAVVHYQEALSHPGLNVPEIRRAISPSILWAAITTVAAFLVLNLGGLPGLGQLGSLVAIGVSLSALVMVLAFLPPLFPGRRQMPEGVTRGPLSAYLFPPAPPRVEPGAGRERFSAWTGLAGTGVVILCAVAILWRGLPGVDRSGDALRLQHTEAEQALEEMSASVGIPQNPLWVIVRGTNEAEVCRALEKAEIRLAEARREGSIGGFLIPTPLWPRGECQSANRAGALWLSTQRESLRESALREGFNTNAVFLAETVARSFGSLAERPGVSWPTNRMSQWLLKRFVARSTNEWLSLGVVYPATNEVSAAAMIHLGAACEQDQVLLSGWPLLGAVTLARVKERLWLLVLPMVALVLASLWLAFRNLRELGLGLAVLGLAGLCLLAVMSLNRWSWNLLNLMALPLILGTGVDYGIFIQLGLRRHAGDVALVRRSIGRALLLCGGTAIAGFGSLAWSSNLGMASLGKVCAVGIAANMLISIFLLPSWWRLVMSWGSAGSLGGGAAGEGKGQPSSFYRAWLWRLGLRLTRRVPRRVLEAACQGLAAAHFALDKARRDVVIENLLPLAGGERERAMRAARALYRQFALKLLDLWRFENGQSIKVAFSNDEDGSGTPAVAFEALGRARASGRGVLLVTPHLGNWEVGALLLKEQGIQLLVVTQAEPGKGLTELRQDSRAKWGVETLVIGNDAFAFVEVIRRLQAGAVVALLIDRPPPPSAVPVEFFGRAFSASIAPAELARASGCALFGVTVLRERQGHYVARLLPEFQYDRRALGNREARRRLTQQILRAFEATVRHHLDQWFHFVPIWPERSPAASRERADAAVEARPAGD
jgi:predicted RND superfamily exporter protein